MAFDTPSAAVTPPYLPTAAATVWANESGEQRLLSGQTSQVSSCYSPPPPTTTNTNTQAKVSQPQTSTQTRVNGPADSQRAHSEGPHSDESPPGDKNID